MKLCSSLDTESKHEVVVPRSGKYYFFFDI